MEGSDYGECPRCGVLQGRHGLASGTRTTDDREPTICTLCGSLEATRDFHRLPPIPPDEWPVDPEELGREFALHVSGHQAGEVAQLPLDSSVAPSSTDEAQDEPAEVSQRVPRWPIPREGSERELEQELAALVLELGDRGVVRDAARAHVEFGRGELTAMYSVVLALKGLANMSRMGQHGEVFGTVSRMSDGAKRLLLAQASVFLGESDWDPGEELPEPDEE
jgi:hypothetical protein